MNELKLNDTPIRTARNFNINNIKIEGITIKKNAKPFKNTIITGGSQNINLERNVSDFDLKYGVGKELIDDIRDNSNEQLKLVIVGKEKQTIEIENNFDEENTSLVENIEIIANEDTEADIVLKYNSSNNLECYHNGIIRAFAKKNARLNITIINFLNTNSNNFFSIENNLEENANVNYIVVDFGGKNSITNYYTGLNRRKSKK